MASNPLRRGPWNLTDLKAVKKNGLKVFSCFHCGGGSSMGYKLAGFDVVGGVEIDPEMMEVYRANHAPRQSYLMGVAEFRQLSNDELPSVLFDLDILDGSPPCSSFSMAGLRDKSWGDETFFREGQTKQVLDDLFFEFIAIAAKLKPKVVVAENVKGLITGKARGYVKQIFKAFTAAGYDCQLFLLNASRMGVPQARERTVFIARRRDLSLPKLVLDFSEPTVTAREATEKLPERACKVHWLTPHTTALWRRVKPGGNLGEVHPRGSRFGECKVAPDKPAMTLTAGSGSGLLHWIEPRRLTGTECMRLQSFPDDYDFLNLAEKYVCGMSVPPFMMQRVADQIEKQWFGGNA